jgi:hypothetical protein
VVVYHAIECFPNGFDIDHSFHLSLDSFSFVIIVCTPVAEQRRDLHGGSLHSQLG